MHAPFAACPPESLETSLPRALPIVALTHEFFPDKAGASVFIQEIMRAAADIGYSVQLLTRGHPKLRDACVPYDLRSLSDTLPRGWRLRALTAHRLLRERGRLHGMMLYLPEEEAMRVFLPLLALGLVRPASLVGTLHGSEILFFRASPFYGPLFARFLRLAERVTVLSEYCRALLVESFAEARDKVVVTPGALRSGFRPVQRRAVPGEQGKIVLLTVARVTPRKGQLEALEALVRLPVEIRSRVIYRIVGPVRDPAYLDKLRRLVERHGLDVEFVGEVEDDELPSIYGAADVFVMTSIRHKHSVEGFGLSYQEAAASGLPVLAHRTGGVEDAVRDGVTGLLVDPDDREALVEALIRLCTDTELRHRLGEAGREWVRHFSWCRAAELTFGN